MSRAAGAACCEPDPGPDVVPGWHPHLDPAPGRNPVRRWAHGPQFPPGSVRPPGLAVGL